LESIPRFVSVRVVTEPVRTFVAMLSAGMFLVPFMLRVALLSPADSTGMVVGVFFTGGGGRMRLVLLARAVSMPGSVSVPGPGRLGLMLVLQSAARLSGVDFEAEVALGRPRDSGKTHCRVRNDVVASGLLGYADAHLVHFDLHVSVIERPAAVVSNGHR
jgi:hypothetical protein